MLLVEQNAKMALSIADRAYVLETGKITMEGKAPRPAARREGAQGLPRRVTSHITMLPLAGATSRSEAEGGYRRFPATTLSQLR